MRKVTIEVEGEELVLAATFDAGVEIAEKVADPLFIAREVGTASVRAMQGQDYDPKFAFSMENLPKIFAAGVRANGDKVDMKKIKAMIFDIGLLEASKIADSYLFLICAPKSQRDDAAEADGEASEPAGE